MAKKTKWAVTDKVLQEIRDCAGKYHFSEDETIKSLAITREIWDAAVKKDPRIMQAVWDGILAIKKEMAYHLMMQIRHGNFKAIKFWYEARAGWGKKETSFKIIEGESKRIHGDLPDDPIAA